jgi:two-component sensor histidine kinase
MGALTRYYTGLIQFSGDIVTTCYTRSLGSLEGGMQRKNERFVERLPLATDRPWIAYSASGALSCLALAARLLADPVLPPGFPFVSFFPAIILSSFLFGVRPGVFSSILCGYFAYHFFVSSQMASGQMQSVIVAMAFYSGVCLTDIALVHWMQRANYKLAVERERSRALAANREMLFSELQHRVSNNIQVVAALLSLQRRNVTDEVAGRALDEASSRLNLVGKIGRALYDPSGEGLGIRSFIATLATDILEASGRRDISVDLDVDESIVFPPDAAVPLSLIVAEAISNAIEHGFANGACGAIAVAVRQTDAGRLHLEIADNGRGLPADFVAEHSKSLGLRIASALAQQLNGTFALARRNGGGAVAMLDIPV